MKNLLLFRIPSICICFTLIVLANTVLDFLYGNEVSLFLPVLFFWLTACQVIDQLFCYVNFKKWSHLCITESAVLYVLSLLVFRLLFKTGSSVSSFVSFTVIFLVADIAIFWYFRKRQQIQAAEINKLLEEKQP